MDDKHLHRPDDLQPPESPTPSDWGQLWEQQRSQNRAFFLNHHTLTQQMAELALAGDANAKQLDRMNARMAKLEAAVEENTELTRGIRDAITAGRVATTAFKWLAGLVITCASAWLAVKGLGKDPGP